MDPRCALCKNFWRRARGVTHNELRGSFPVNLRSPLSLAGETIQFFRPPLASFGEADSFFQIIDEGLLCPPPLLSFFARGDLLLFVRAVKTSKLDARRVVALARGGKLTTRWATSSFLFTKFHALWASRAPGAIEEEKFYGFICWQWEICVLAGGPRKMNARHLASMRSSTFFI